MPEPRRSATAAWILYDLANTIFSFNILSLYFPVWLHADLGLPDSAFAIGNSISMALVLVLAPVLGALSDRARRRIPFLIASTLVCVLATLGLGLGAWPVALALFVVANVGFQAGLIFYDALLAGVSTPASRGRIGALGVGVGYVGSFLGLGFGAAILSGHEERDAWVFAATGASFLLFALPAFFLVRERAVARVRVTWAHVRAAARESFAGLARLLRGRDHPGLRRFLIGRLFYTDAANTMILFMGVYAVSEAGFTEAGVRIVLLMGILGAALLAPAWGILVDRVGSKHTLDLVLLVWVFGLLMVALVPILKLPQGVFYPLAFLLGGALGGTWSADRPLMLGLAPAHRLGEFYGIYAMVGRFAAILGPLLWATIVDVLHWGRATAVLSLLVFMLVAFAILRRLPDPAHPGPTRLGSFLPWHDANGRPTPRPPRWWTKAPAHAVYLALTTAAYYALVRAYARNGGNVIDVDRVPAGFQWAFVFEIPHLFADPLRTLVNFVASVWVNYHPVQLVYVWALLLLFGVWFEIREGTRRAALVFYLSSIVSGLFAGGLLHLLRALFDAAWIEDTWGRAWTGGSAGAFGLMGAVAARAPRPWLLLGLFVLWEVNVEAWYLQSYTPAFHLSALAFGYALTRWFLPATRPPEGTPAASDHRAQG